MRICIDSCIFVHGLQGSDPVAVRLLDLVGREWDLMVPHLVAQEVSRNLSTPEQARRFYRLFHEHDSASIVYEPIPRALVDKYVGLGLPAKADAFIGAFAEWVRARYLISDNRHFLRQLQTDAFEVLEAAEFISRWEVGALR